MSPENFCYWLQGFFELTDPNEISEKQIMMIQEHLQLVFKKETKISLKQEVNVDSASSKNAQELIKEVKKQLSKVKRPAAPVKLRHC